MSAKCIHLNLVKCVSVCVQCSSYSCSEEGPGSECVWGAGARPAVYTHPGETAPLPGTLYFVSTGTLGVSERFHQVCYVIVSDGTNIWLLSWYHNFNSSLSFFLSYFSQLLGSGQEMRELVRHSYHLLVLMLVEAVQSFNALNEKWVFKYWMWIMKSLCALEVSNNKYATQELPMHSVCPLCLMSVVCSVCP